MNIEDKRKKRKLGLCYYCSEPAGNGYSACPRHRESHYWSVVKYNKRNREKINAALRDAKIKRKKEGLCRDCGKPLDGELDSGYICCLNCRIGCRRPRWVTYGINPKESTCQP